MHTNSALFVMLPRGRAKPLHQNRRASQSSCGCQLVCGVQLMLTHASLSQELADAPFATFQDNEGFFVKLLQGIRKDGLRFGPKLAAWLLWNTPKVREGCCNLQVSQVLGLSSWLLLSDVSVRMCSCHTIKASASLSRLSETLYALDQLPHRTPCTRHQVQNAATLHPLAQPDH